MKQGKRIALAVAAGAILLGAGSACSEIAPPDQVGLYYLEGQSDGYKFDHCYNPGSTDDLVWNNSTILVPANRRTWNIAPGGTPGADSNTPIVVTSKPEEGQPSGVQISLWTHTSFTLNTFCGKDNHDPNSPVVRWWETIGRRYYEADTTEDKSKWWEDMLGATIVSAQETAARSVGRTYTPDELVSGMVREQAQREISALFQAELRRVAGGDYFCSPTFDRLKGDCGTVEILLKDADYTNAAIQAARDEKQAAIEKAAAQVAEAKGKAAAQVAEAQGRVDAAAKLAKLYSNKAWLELELAKLQAEACRASASCTVVSGQVTPVQNVGGR